jgi:hypothetical protein
MLNFILMMNIIQNVVLRKSGHIKGVISIRKSWKNRQFSVQRKKDQQTKNDS